MSQRIESSVYEQFKRRNERQWREDFSRWEQSPEKELLYPSNWLEEWTRRGKDSQVKQHLFNKYGRTEGRYAGCPGKGIFTDSYIKMANDGQAKVHFPECFAAVHYYRQRYQVLVEKYSFPKHKEMYGRAEQVLQPYNGLWPFLVKVTREGQPPDLLVYRCGQRSTELFFVEVKHEDDFTDNQKQLFPFIDAVWPIPIKIVRLRLVPGTPIPF